MSADIDLWFRTKSEDLGTDSKIKSTLVEMKTVILNSDSTIVSRIAECSNTMNAVFDCFNTSDTEQIELSSDTVFLLLKSLNGVLLLSNYESFLHRALGHPSPQIKSSMLKLLHDVLDDEVVAYLCGNPVLLQDAVLCLQCPERSIAQGAVKLLTKLGSSEEGLKLLFSPSMLENMKKVSQVDDITRFRVYEVTVGIAVEIEAGLKESDKSGLLPALVTELKSSDSLIQLNVLELMNSLSSANHGLAYLQDSGVIPYLVEKILKIEDEPLSYILLPGLIEFFGNIFKVKPQEFSQMYPQTLKVLFHGMETPDPVLLGTIITTIGKLGSTNEGKLVLEAEGVEMSLFFNKLSKLLLNKNDIGLTVINVLCVLLDADNNDQHILKITETWFNELGTDALETITNIAKLPFMDLRLPALQLLKIITAQNWGLAKICSFPGMPEYLLNRDSEVNKNCKYAKYEIVEIITKSPNISTILSTDLLLKMKEFVNEGPFYVPTEPEVVIESQT